MRRAALLILGLALLAGCSPTSAALPEDVTVSVFQNRFDYSARVLEIKVGNGTDETITVTRAAFESTRFAEPATWDRPQHIPAGAARDLKVQLPEARCDDVPVSDSVTLQFTLADGMSGIATLTPSDEQGRVDTINSQDCLRASVDGIVALSPPDALDWTPGAHAPATIEIAVEPTGAAGAVTIHRAMGTVLLGLSDEAGAPLTVLPLDLVADASTAATGIRLSVIPNRCDPHAVEEDKRGTFFPLDVETTDGRSGIVYITVGDDVRRSLYEFYAD